MNQQSQDRSTPQWIGNTCVLPDSAQARDCHRSLKAYMERGLWTTLANCPLIVIITRDLTMLALRMCVRLHTVPSALP